MNIMKKTLILISSLLLFWSGLANACSSTDSNFSVTFTLASAPIDYVVWAVGYEDTRSSNSLTRSPSISKVGESATADNNGDCKKEPDQGDTIQIGFYNDNGLSTSAYDSSCNNYTVDGQQAFQVENNQLQIDTDNFNGYITGNIELTLYPSKSDENQGTVYCNYDDVQYHTVE